MITIKQQTYNHLVTIPSLYTSNYLFGPYFTRKLFALFLRHWLQSVFVQQYFRVDIVPLVMFGANQHNWCVRRVLGQFFEPLGLDAFETVGVNDAETQHEDIGIGVGETSQYGEVLLKLEEMVSKNATFPHTLTSLTLCVYDRISRTRVITPSALLHD